MSRKYDVFISYRRDGGDDCAMWLKTRLERDGFHPYLDVEAYSPGSYREQIAQALREVDSVIVLLTSHCLDRCFEENDAVHDEIAASIALNKHIVSVLKRGFTFPDTLPEDIDSLRNVNALPLENYYRDTFYANLLAALRQPALLTPGEPVKNAPLSVGLQPVEGVYTGFLDTHVSGDLRLIALADPLRRTLNITQADTGKLICRLSPLKHPFHEYRLIFNSSMHYLYLLRGKNALIFDIQRNQYVTLREIALPFAAKRTYDAIFWGDGGAIVLIDYESGRPNCAVCLTPRGEAHAFPLKNYPAGQAIASMLIAGKRALIMTQPNGRVYALCMEEKKLLQCSTAQTIEACLQSGKRFGNCFSPENLYWSQTSSNGVTHYTDFYRTEDGEKLHRIFHGEGAVSFTQEHTAVWYDPQSRRLRETDFLRGDDRTVLDEKAFSLSPAFYHCCPAACVYLCDMDLCAFLAVSEDAQKRFRLVLTDRAGHVLTQSAEMLFPEHTQYFTLQENGAQLLLALGCAQDKEQYTKLYTARIQAD